MILLLIDDPYIYNILDSIPFVRSLFRFSPKGLTRVRDKAQFVKLINKIQLANGSFKTTKINRFKEIDEYLINTLSPEKKYSIHDVAVSDGITSLELKEKLELKSIDHELVISDKYSELFYYYKNGFTTYYDVDHMVVMKCFFNILLDSNLSWKFFLSKVLGPLNRHEKIKDIEKEKTNKKSIYLINPVTAELIKSGIIKFRQIDIFENKSEIPKYDIVRCMNILNPRYFSEAQLTKAVQGLFGSLKNDGFLIVGRTEISTGKNLATIFQKKNGNLVVRNKFNKGAEIESLIERSISI